MEQNHYYNHGNEKKIAFVFSVPGKLELYNNRPVVGETGVLLEDLMRLLKSKVFEKYDESRRTNRYDYRITNAWVEPLYKAKDDKTEAANKVIIVDKNIERLYNELKDISDVIFVFGNKAKLAVENMAIKKTKEPQPLKAKKIIYTRHLGLMSINQIKNDVSNEPLNKGDKNNTNKRLKVIAREILSQIEKNKK